MAHWIQFSEDYDYRWPDGAVTAFKAGSKVYVKDEVAEAVAEAKVAQKASKPKAGDPEHRPTAVAKETSRYKPNLRTVKSNFSGYPDLATRRAMEAAATVAATAPGIDDRSESAEETVRDNEALEVEEKNAELAREKADAQAKQ